MEHSVLIGTVKSRLQLEVSLNEKFYHIPKAVVPKNMLPVEYVALYLPAGVFGGGECITCYGKVVSTEVVSRGEIASIPTRNADRKYYKFSVEEWLPLENRIARDRGGVYAKAFTSLEKLLSAQKLSDIAGAAAVKERRRIFSRGVKREELRSVPLSSEPIGVKKLALRVNEALGKEKVTAVQITKYLLDKGYLEVEVDEKTEREIRVPTEKGKALGIENFWEINKYYREFNKNYYSVDAQRFIIEHLNEIIRIKITEAFKNE